MIWRLAMTLAALAGCTWGEPLVPAVSAVSPPVVANDADAILIISGSGFVPAVKVDFDDASRTRVSGAYGAELRRGTATPVPLQEVTVVSSSDVRGRMPALTSPGDWDVVLIAPDGTEAKVPGALKVRVTTCVDSNGPCDDRNPCTSPDTCQGFTCNPGPALADGTSCEVVCIDRSLHGSCVSGACVPSGEGC